MISKWHYLFNFCVRLLVYSCREEDKEVEERDLDRASRKRERERETEPGGQDDCDNNNVAYMSLDFNLMLGVYEIVSFL